MLKYNFKTMTNLNVPFILLQKDQIYNNFKPDPATFKYYSSQELAGYAKPP